ncbi:MAG: DUF4870 domain-containing protein [Thermodesulfobacteriota bacterium]
MTEEKINAESASPQKEDKTAPQPPETGDNQAATTELSKDDNLYAVLSHLAPLAGYLIIIGQIAVPLLILLTKGKESDYIKYHATESLNFQISVTIYWIITYMLIFLLIGIPIAIGLAIFTVVLMIIATVKASNGELYRYPLIFRFVK